MFGISFYKFVIFQQNVKFISEHFWMLTVCLIQERASLTMTPCTVTAMTPKGLSLSRSLTAKRLTTLTLSRSAGTKQEG